MRIPRDVSGKNLISLLSKLDYKVTRQTGSHVRLTRLTEKEHHITIPLHDPIKLKTLDSILKDIANNLNITKSELIQLLFK